MKKYNLIIIGAGPAGMFAAITAAKNSKNKNFSILLLDSNFKLGRKLLVTGNGRCNITNRNIRIENYHGTNTKFLYSIFSQFTNTDLLKFFEEKGAEFKEENYGNIFPVTNQASTILEILKEELEYKKIIFQLNTRVIKIEKNNDNLFEVHIPENKILTSEKVIIATGGMAYPQIGALPDGYEFAKKFGHTIIKPLPALVPLEIDNKVLFDLQGVKIIAEIKAYKDNQFVSSITDEILFTHYGISGPGILLLSNKITRFIEQSKITLKLNFFPEKSFQEVEEKIIKIWKSNPNRTLGNSLTGILPKKIPQILMRNILNLNIDMLSCEINKETRRKILKLITSLEITIKNRKEFNDAQITSGGVDTNEINPKTMESKLCKNLFFAGEVIDINGDCGGYNLQFAFSTGFIAGLNASR